MRNISDHTSFSPEFGLITCAQKGAGSVIIGSVNLVLELSNELLITR